MNQFPQRPDPSQWPNNGPPGQPVYQRPDPMVWNPLFPPGKDPPQSGYGPAPQPRSRVAEFGAIALVTLAVVAVVVFHEQVLLFLSSMRFVGGNYMERIIVGAGAWGLNLIALLGAIKVLSQSSGDKR